MGDRLTTSRELGQKEKEQTGHARYIATEKRSQAQAVFAMCYCSLCRNPFIAVRAEDAVFLFIVALSCN